MKKSKFIQSSILLLIGGFLTKVLGMLGKIVLTRKIGTLGMGLYSLLMPTFMLFLSISGMGLSTALNVLIATDKYNNKNLLITSLFLSFLVNFLIAIVILFGGNWIVNSLLHEKILYYPLLSILFVLPFISVSNIFRSYFFAKERMLPHVFSNILEDLWKLLLIFFFMNLFLGSMEQALTFLMMTNILCEFSSIVIFLFCFPKFHLQKEDFYLKKDTIKAIFKISIPTTLSRLIGSITYFLEPVILTTILLKLGYSKNNIITEYGIINGYVLPLLMLPSFFTGAISQALMPIISKYYHKKDYAYVKRKLKQAICLSILIGLSYSTICYFYHPELLQFLYQTKEGSSYILFLIPIFFFYYLESPLLTTLQAMNKAKLNLRISFINFLIRTILLAIFTSLSIGMYGVLIALSINILFTVIYAFYKVEQSLHF